MDKNIGKAIQRAVQSKKYVRRIEVVKNVEYQNYLIGEIFRYIIIFKDENGLEEYIAKLIKAMDAKKQIRELNMIRDTTYASRIVSLITKRRHKITQEELNEKVFEYMYKNLITYGYVFHAFNAKLAESILKNGLDITKKTWEDIKIEQIENILKKYNIEEPFVNYKLFSKEGVAFTSNFTNLYTYAKYSPAFLSNFIINTKDPEGELAIYNRDAIKIKQIVLKYLREYNLEKDDLDIVMLFIEENVDKYIKKGLAPHVALVERNSIEFLKGMYISYTKYKDGTNLEESEIDEYSIVSYILNVQDNFTDFRLKDKVKKEEILILQLPEYMAERVEQVEEIEDVEEAEEVQETSKNLEAKDKKVVQINGDILFGYIYVKTSLKGIKEDYKNRILTEKNQMLQEDLEEIDEEEYEEEDLEEVEENLNKEEFTLSFTSLNTPKVEEKEDKYTLSFASINKKPEPKPELEILEEKEEEEVSDVTDDFVEKLFKRVEDGIKNEKIEEVEVEVEEEVEEETEAVIEEENIPEEVEEVLAVQKPVKEEIIVEKVIVEKVTKKYKVQSRRVKIRKKGELSAKEKIDLAIERAHRRQEENENLKIENEQLLQAELANIEKFALEIINEISEKVEKEVEIVKNTKIFKNDMTKEELDAFNQSIINKICASNIEEEVLSERVKEYNPIEEYENRISNMEITDFNLEDMDEYDPVAEYEKQLMELEKREKELENTPVKTKLDELFSKINEEEAEELEDLDESEYVQVEETEKLEDIAEEVLETNQEEDLDVVSTDTQTINIDEIQDKQEDFVLGFATNVDKNKEIKEVVNEDTITIVEEKPLIPITLLKEVVDPEYKIESTRLENIQEEEVLENEVEINQEETLEEVNELDSLKQTFKIEESEDPDDVFEDEVECIEEDFDSEIDEILDKKQKAKKNMGLNLPIFNKTELKPETQKVIQKLKEKALNLITVKDTTADEMENVETKQQAGYEEDNLEYRRLAVCDVENIDVSMYVNNVISDNATIEDMVNSEIEKKEALEKILDKSDKKEEAENAITEIDEMEAPQEIQATQEMQEIQDVCPEVENKFEEIQSNVEELNSENRICEVEEYPEETEKIFDEEEVSKGSNELTEEEIQRLIEEDELYMDDPSYVGRGNKVDTKYKDIIPNDMETSLIVKTTLMESFKLALKDFTRKIAENFTTSFDAEHYEQKASKSQKIRRSPRLGEYGTYNDYKKTNKIDRVVNLMEDKSLRERRPRYTKEYKNEIITNEKESFIEDLYKEINTNTIRNNYL